MQTPKNTYYVLRSRLLIGILHPASGHHPWYKCQGRRCTSSQVRDQLCQCCREWKPDPAHRHIHFPSSYRRYQRHQKCRTYHAASQNTRMMLAATHLSIPPPPFTIIISELYNLRTQISKWWNIWSLSKFLGLPLVLKDRNVPYSDSSVLSQRAFSVRFRKPIQKRSDAMFKLSSPRRRAWAKTCAKTAKTSVHLTKYLYTNIKRHLCHSKQSPCLIHSGTQNRHYTISDAVSDHSLRIGFKGLDTRSPDTFK